MNTQQIVERGGPRVTLPEGNGLKGRIRLMGWEPGADSIEGSSGIYPVKVIKRDFAEAFPQGTRIRANHDGLCEAGGDIRRIVAKTTSAPTAEKDGMYADVIFAEQWSTFAKEFADVVGMSISAAAEMDEWPEEQEFNDWGQAVDEDGNVLKGTVKRFLTQEESPYNSVDIVEAPGADGRIVALALEAAQHKLVEMNVREAATFAVGTIKPIAEKDSEATPPRSNEEEDMTEEERKALVAEAAQAGATAALEQFRAAESAPEQPTLGVLAEAVTTAGLTEAGRASVYERVESGVAFDVAIATEKAREDAMRAELSGKSATPTPGFGYTVGEDEGGKPQVNVNEEFDKIEVI